MINALRDGMYYIEGDMGLEMNTVSPLPPHTHDFIEFVYMLKGKGIHRVNGTEYPLAAGDLLIINYGEEHSFDGDPTFCNLLIKPAFLDDSMRECRDLFAMMQEPRYREFRELVDNHCRHIRFSREEKNSFEYMLRLLDKELKDREPGFGVTTHTGVDFLLVMIFRKMCMTEPAVQGEFGRVLEYIGDHYADRITAQSLAQMCYYTPSYFSRVFKRYTGVTFSRYLQRVRVLNACRLMDNGCRVSDVYTRVGYSDKTGFYKHFRQIMGMSPLAYKKNRHPGAR